MSSFNEATIAINKFLPMFNIHVSSSLLYLRVHIILLQTSSCNSSLDRGHRANSEILCHNQIIFQLRHYFTGYIIGLIFAVYARLNCPIRDATHNPCTNKIPASSDESDKTIVNSKHLMMLEQLRGEAATHGFPQPSVARINLRDHFILSVAQLYLFLVNPTLISSI